jgi:hypothetical protein
MKSKTLWWLILLAALLALLWGLHQVDGLALLKRLHGG